MKYLFINSVCGYGSTGKIVVETCKNLMQQGHECAVAWGRICTNADAVKNYRIGSKIDNYFHALGTRLFDTEGFGSKRATRRLITWIKEYQPDVIWLHNLHGYYLNIELLFEYIKSIDVEIVWTLHDCWAFTGHCGYFTMANCVQWQSHCRRCVQKHKYPTCWVKSNAYSNFERKRKAFIGVNNLKIIVPSKWLSGIVKQSFLREYEIEVKYNTIDTNIFRPMKNEFRKNNGLENKVILLGVASVWDERKGLHDFFELSKRLDDSYAIVLVGVRKNQIKQEYPNIMYIQRTNNIFELAEIYSAADVYLNLTYEDNYPTTNLEAQACGTPCITYDTGGSGESVPKENVVKVGDIDAVLKRIECIVRE